MSQFRLVTRIFLGLEWIPKKRPYYQGQAIPRSSESDFLLFQEIVLQIKPNMSSSFEILFLGFLETILLFTKFFFDKKELFKTIAQEVCFDWFFILLHNICKKGFTFNGIGGIISKLMLRKFKSILIMPLKFK